MSIPIEATKNTAGLRCASRSDLCLGSSGDQETLSAHREAEKG
jgi:hypothetical protein